LLTLFVWQARWRLRRWFWDAFAAAKFFTNTPLAVTASRPPGERIDTMPLSASLSFVRPDAHPLAEIKAAAHIPRDEKSFRKTRYPLKRLAFPFQQWAYRWLSPMQQDLPPINADPHVALTYAYRGWRRRGYDAPVLPPEFLGSPDLGSLAVRGPYACYLRKGREADEWEWDLTSLGQYECYKELYPLDVRVLFTADGQRLRERSIMSGQIGRSVPGDPQWPFAKQLALCALSNHMTLVRHWNWVHLIPASAFAIATRNHLDRDHPIARLLWPHIFGTIQSNAFGNMAQLAPEGDFEHVFSFTRAGLYDLLRDSHRSFSFDVTDPSKDAGSRGLVQPPFLTPTQANLTELFGQFLNHTGRYVALYYPAGQLDQARRSVHTTPHIKAELQALASWLEQLNSLIPNGTGYEWDRLSRDDLAALLAQLIYLVTTVHETVGAALWNYQLWPHRQPVRMYRDGRREPLDVYQRLVNFNYLLNVDRTPLVADYSHLALPGPLEEQARTVFQEFQRSLERCDAEMRNQPWAVWKIYPCDLEAHINA
jgi:arachidonate 15-lipoxygenase